MPDNDSSAEDNIVELVDVASDAPHKSKNLSNQTMNFITNSKYNKGTKIHDWYKKL